MEVVRREAPGRSGREERRKVKNHSHSRAHIHKPNTFGQLAADRIANGMGSWRFIILQSVFVAGWIVLNLVGFVNHWDVYPFILLNLLFSTQAAYAAPIIMMSQNRQAQKDHLRDDLEAKEVDILFKINQQQLEILHLLRHQILPDQPLESEVEAATSMEARELESEAVAIQELGTH
jgi:uncharacterized membrane protein